MPGSELGNPDLQRHVFERAWDAILVFRADNLRIVDANPRACEMYGYEYDELVKLRISDLSARPQFGQRQIDRVVAQGRVPAFETVHRRKDARKITVEVSGTLIDHEGYPAILSISRDVTAQREAEARVRLSERQYRFLFEHNPEPMWIFAASTLTFLAVNDAATRRYGYSREQFLCMSLSQVQSGQSQSKVLDDLERLARALEPSAPSIHKTADGREFFVSVSSHQFVFEGESAWFQQMTDVTEEFAARETLARREAYYRTLIENAMDLITIVGADGIVLYESPSAERILGRRPQEIVGKPLTTHMHPDDMATAMAVISSAIAAAGATGKTEVRVQHADGRYRILEGIGYNLLDDPSIRGIVLHSRDVTERREAEDALRRSEERLRLAQQAGRIGTWDFDLRTHLTTCSDENAALFGAPNRPVWKVSDWEKLIHPDDRDRVVTRLIESGQLGRSFADEFRILLRNGAHRWLSSRAEVMFDAAGRPERYLGIHLDITDRKRVEEEQALARDQALTASRMKSQFLATVSHEIRTPMNGIIGMTGLLLDSNLTDQQRADAETIRTSALFLLELINDLLDVSRIEAGKMSLNIAPFSLRACLETVIDLLAPQAAAKGLRMVLDYPPDLPSDYVGDDGRVRQIVLNFAGNAVKFTDAGNVVIRVATPSASGIRISVIDTGPGIPAVDQKSLFSKFLQLDGSSTRRHGGTGLGLAISKSLAEAMGGSVGLISEAGRGAEFYVELPLPRASAERIPKTRGQQRRSNRGTNGTNCRVLVVEDNKVNQQLAVRLLEKRGIRVDVAGDGHEALAMWERFPYDLILMDCQMPGLDGYQTTETIRKHSHAKRSVPIVAITAFAGSGEHERCQQAGMNAVLTKPYNAQEFDALLEQWLPA